MTVAELIEKLKQFDPNLPVRTYYPFVAGHGCLEELDSSAVDTTMVVEQGRAYYDGELTLHFHNDEFVSVLKIGYDD